MVFNHMAGILQNGEPGIVVLSQTSPASPGQQLGPHKNSVPGQLVGVVYNGFSGPTPVQMPDAWF
jgi:hypothetical protein